jgi:outer membrane protein TolC
MLTVGVMDLTLPRFAFRESDFTEVDVEISQEFPWPGTLGARAGAARAQARAREAMVSNRQRDLTARTAEVYYRLRYVVTARHTLARQRRLLFTGVEIATARYASTSVPQGDPLQARVALARLDTEEASLAAEEEELRAGLKALRNATGPDSLAIEPMPLSPDSLAHLQGTGPHVRDSVPEHPRLQARRAEIEAAQHAVRVEELGARPDFTIMARYGGRPLGADFFSAFVGIRVPLYAGRKQHRLAEAGRADAEASRAALVEEQAGLREAIRTMHARIGSEARRLDLLTRQVIPASREAVEATLRSYRVGQVGFLTVLAAQDALYRAELDAARAAAERHTHLVMLEQLVTPERVP